jgi:hypothetical protein
MTAVGIFLTFYILFGHPSREFIFDFSKLKLNLLYFFIFFDYLDSYYYTRWVQSKLHLLTTTHTSYENSLLPAR